MSELDIFNLDGDMFVDKQPETGEDTGFYKPYPQNGKDGVYKSLIRFLPNQADPSKSKIHKYYVYLTDPTDGKGSPVDCPSTVGKKSILKDMYWKLKNSNSAADQDLAKNFSRKEDYFSLVQIIEDKNSPELEGKILIYKFGRKINEMLEGQLKPEYGDPVNPYDLFGGKEFSLHVRKVGEWNNYDLCSFVGDRKAISIDGKLMEKNETDMASIIEFLKSGPQNLTNFEYKDWDTATTEKVMGIIRNTVSDGRIINEVVGGAATSTGAPAAATSTPTPTPVAAPSNDGAKKLYKEASETSIETAPPTTPAPASTSSSLDDLYANL